MKIPNEEIITADAPRDVAEDIKFRRGIKLYKRVRRRRKIFRRKHQGSSNKAGLSTITPCRAAASRSIISSSWLI